METENLKKENDQYKSDILNLDFSRFFISANDRTKEFLSLESSSIETLNKFLQNWKNVTTKIDNKKYYIYNSDSVEYTKYYLFCEDVKLYLDTNDDTDFHIVDVEKISFDDRLILIKNFDNVLLDYLEKINNILKILKWDH